MPRRRRRSSRWRSLARRGCGDRFLRARRESPVSAGRPTSTVQGRAEALDPETFFGVPIRGFDRGGRAQLILLLMAGLEPRSKVVDLGCGVLRAGYWLVHFLDPGCYHGIEPHEGRLRTGL